MNKFMLNINPNIYIIDINIQIPKKIFKEIIDKTKINFRIHKINELFYKFLNETRYIL